MRPVPPSVVGLEFGMDDWAGSDLRNSWVSESADSWQVTYLLAWGGSWFAWFVLFLFLWLVSYR